MTRALTAGLLVVAVAIAACGKREDRDNSPMQHAAQAAPSSVSAAGFPAPPKPDRSEPLDAYTPVEATATLTMVSLAFASMPMSSEERFARTPEAAQAGDAFAKRDAMAKVLPELDAKIATVKQQRYYKIDLAPPAARPDPGVKAIAWNGWTFPADPYDFDRKGFPIACPMASVVTNRTPKENYFESVDFEPVNAPVPGTALHGAMCLLPVADEAAAKVLEAARARANNRLRLGRATLYFFVVDAAPGGFPLSRSIRAVLTHADLVLVDPANPNSELAHAALDL
jgi:hypothetical protein